MPREGERNGPHLPKPTKNATHTRNGAETPEARAHAQIQHTHTWEHRALARRRLVAGAGNRELHLTRCALQRSLPTRKTRLSDVPRERGYSRIAVPARGLTFVSGTGACACLRRGPIACGGAADGCRENKASCSELRLRLRMRAPPESIAAAGNLNSHIRRASPCSKSESAASMQ